MKRLFLGVLSIATIITMTAAVYATHSVSAQEELICEEVSSSIASDESTQVNGTSSVPVDNDTGSEGNQVPGAWTASIAGATWIWSDAQEDGAAATGTEVFTREFNFSSDATSSAVLNIATDNSYEVRLNGVLVASDASEINFTLETQDVHDISSELVDGTNTLEITVTNADNGGDNPAGLLYRLDLEGFDCEEVSSEPSGEIIEPDEDEVVSGITELIAVYDDGDEENDDSVQWAVREGTCAAGVNTVFGNVDGHSDSFSWDGMNFSAFIDTTEVDDGEYCFIFNPTDDGDTDVRETVNFLIDNDEEGDDDDDEEDDEEKVTICHIPPGNPDNAKTLNIDASDVDDHLGHGDHEGECDEEELEAFGENRGQSNKNR